MLKVVAAVHSGPILIIAVASIRVVLGLLLVKIVVVSSNNSDNNSSTSSNGYNMTETLSS